MSLGSLGKKLGACGALFANAPGGRVLPRWIVISEHDVKPMA